MSLHFGRRRREQRDKGRNGARSSGKRNLARRCAPQTGINSMHVPKNLLPKVGTDYKVNDTRRRLLAVDTGIHERRRDRRLHRDQRRTDQSDERRYGARRSNNRDLDIACGRTREHGHVR